MARPPRADVRLTALALLIVLGSAAAGLVSNELSNYLPGVVLADPIAYFSATLGIIFLVSTTLIALDGLAPEGSLRRRNRRILTLIICLRVLQGLLVAFAGIVSNPAWSVLASSLPAWLGTRWLRAIGPWLAIVVVALVVALPFVYEWFERRSRGVKSTRERFLNQLSRRYDRYLDDAIHVAVRAALRVAEVNVALRRPELTVDASGSDKSALAAAWTLPPDQTLRDLYEQAGGHLLILGGPGSGKSTQIYELGRDLVERAKIEAADPFPVVLDLSSWAANRDPVERWLVEAIVEIYRVRKDIAQTWVDSDKIVPLLDALDGMADDDRARCIVALNTYHRAHPEVPLVVCCRSDDYARLRDGLEIKRAVALEPLTDGAILGALADGGPRLDRLRTVVAADAALRAALRAPLLLSLAVRTYNDLRGDDIPPVTDLEAWRQQLFGRYVRKALQRDSGAEQPDDNQSDTGQSGIHFTEEELAKTLAWLGYSLRAHDRNVFFLQRLQADWLPDTTARRRYHRIRFALLDPSAPIRPIAGMRWSWSGARSAQIEVLVELLLSLPIDLLGDRVWIAPLILLGVALICAQHGVLLSVLIAILIVLVVLVLIAVLIGSLIGGLRGVEVDEDDLQRGSAGIHRSARVALSCGVGIGAGTGLAAGLLVSGAGRLIDWQVNGPTLGQWVVRSGRALDATLSESVVPWLARYIIAVLEVSVLPALLLVLLGILMRKRKRAWVITATGIVMTALPCAVLAAISFGAFDLRGWLETMLNGLDLVTMASTIATGKYNGLLVVVLFVLIGVMLAGFEGMLIGGITGALVVALSGVFSSPLLTGLVTGLGIGVGFGMKFGGNAVMKHLALRHALRKSGVVPPGLERLLDEATDLVLLQRIGGGYQFIHQTIRDYFAKQYLLSKTSGGAKTK